MATTKVEIVNRALRKIKQNPIQDLSEQTPAGEAADAVYDEARQHVLIMAPWTFAVRRAALARLSAAPAFGYDYKYRRPADFLYLVEVFTDEAGTIPLRDYRLEEDGLHSSYDEVYARYVYDLTDPNKMSALFRAALEDYLAYLFALNLPGSKSLAEQHLEKFENVTLPRAAGRDAMQDGARAFPETTWTTTRWSGAGGRRKG